jgi:tRNA-dihydrouridine synthase C
MEGVGDRCFRKAMASVGGFDEAVTDFIRVPSNAHVESLARVYEPDETAPIPLAAQLMGSDPELMAAMAVVIERRGAPRIDLNCGCPSNTVTGRGAGSSLLKDPTYLYDVAKAIVRAVKVPVSIKMRSGYEDTSLFRENLLAAQESGAVFVTVHPRTKVDGYGPPAKWEFIAEAKQVLKIPVVGNGDIVSADDAKRMVAMTQCDALMVGRGAVIDPFVFHRIRAAFAGRDFQPDWRDMQRYFDVYLGGIPSDTPERGKVNKLKQLMGFLFKGSEALLKERQGVLTSAHKTLEEFLAAVMPVYKRLFVS